MNQPKLFVSPNDPARNLLEQGRAALQGLLEQPSRVTASGHPPEAHLKIDAPKTPSKWPKRLFAGAALLALIAAGVAYYETQLAPYESTDDAFIESHVTTVAPQVAGRVMRLLVADNQRVKAGDVLAEIDPRDYDAKLAEAQAGLAEANSRLSQARAQFDVDQAKAGEAKANVAAAQADATRAAADWQRYQSIETRAVAQTQIDLAQDQARAAAAQLQVAQNRALAAAAQVKLSQSSIATAEAQVQAAQAKVREAELNLSYTRITAPVEGYVAKRTVETGAYVQPGQPLLAIVPAQVWIIANFKETQLTDLRPGEPVEVTLDAYPQHKFKGHVDSVQDGAGARFSLLPPENATGNFVKVVQRVPVKIVLDEKVDDNYTLGPGMSVVPTVKVR